MSIDKASGFGGRSWVWGAVVWAATCGAASGVGAGRAQAAVARAPADGMGTADTAQEEPAYVRAASWLALAVADGLRKELPAGAGRPPVFDQSYGPLDMDQAPEIGPARAVAAQTRVLKTSAGQAVAGSYLRLSGNVTLTGTGYMPDNSTIVVVQVHGTAELRDDSGRSVGSAEFWDTVSCNVPSNQVICWARPRADVPIHRDGRYLGTVRVEGSFSVSGVKSGHALTLLGSGDVSGSGYVQDSEPEGNAAMTLLASVRETSTPILCVTAKIAPARRCGLPGQVSLGRGSDDAAR